MSGPSSSCLMANVDSAQYISEIYIVWKVRVCANAPVQLRSYIALDKFQTCLHGSWTCSSGERRVALRGARIGAK